MLFFLRQLFNYLVQVHQLNVCCDMKGGDEFKQLTEETRVECRANQTS